MYPAVVSTSNSCLVRDRIPRSVVIIAAEDLGDTVFGRSRLRKRRDYILFSWRSSVGEWGLLVIMIVGLKKGEF